MQDLSDIQGRCFVDNPYIVERRKHAIVRPIKKRRLAPTPEYIQNRVDWSVLTNQHSHKASTGVYFAV